MGVMESGTHEEGPRSTLKVGTFIFFEVIKIRVYCF